MSTDTLTADPELQQQSGPETTHEHPGHHHHRESRDQDGASRVNHDVEQDAPGNGEIEMLAYRYWQDRGCPDGCPEEDWYRAERELAERQQIDNRS